MTRKTITITLGIIIVISIGLIFLYASSGGGGGNTDHAVMERDTIVEAKVLYDAFKNDDENPYLGEITTVTGFVVYTGPDVYALPSVELSESEGGTSRLLCVLPFSDYLKLTKVSKGDHLIIRGEVRGFYEKGDQVLMKQCVILEKE